MALERKRPIALVILDGWGVSARREGNAIAQAHTPVYDEICEVFPSTILTGCREDLRASIDSHAAAELGHRTMGAGRTVLTPSVVISDAIRSGDFFTNDVLLSGFRTAATKGSSVHFLGMLSDAGIESSQETLFALLRMAKLAGVTNAFVHAILDGRDVQPRTADIYVDALEIKMADIGLGKIATLCGRFYAMDSSQNWERTARVFTMMVHGEGERAFDAVTAVRASFLRGISDEFIAPIVIESRLNEPVTTVRDGDLVVFFNHRGESMRQIVRSLALPDASAVKPRVDAICLTEYEAALGLRAAFKEREQNNSLASIFDYCGIRNYRITESARAAHVAEYFNGRPDWTSDFEKRVTFRSLAANQIEFAPESASFKVADGAINAIDSDRSGVFIVNIPAPDIAMAAGSISKCIEGVQFVDTCLGGVLEKIRDVNGIAIVTSSHPGCEAVGLSQGTPNPVPMHLIDPVNRSTSLDSGGSLEDIAPTILGLLGLNIPSEMSGRDLRVG